MKLTEDQIKKLGEKLPDWAVKAHPTKTNMSAIHPMSIIDRLNDVFGIGGWNFETEFIKCEPFVQKTKNGERNMWMSAVKGCLYIGSEEDGFYVEQYGGSSNDDMGDALKGGATDALTKIASYLNIGAEIYKGHGNKEVGTVAMKAPSVQPEAGKGIPKTVFDRLYKAYESTGVMTSDMIPYFEKCNTEQRKQINDLKLKLRKAKEPAN